ncbi:TetR/AcrR family transcriptional regulator [Cellulomonas sp. NPDC057328]|uniref:TetR/AcrR family transcriptional regulator n=1 Tax=Cellulomonas sp. NPDC057328 TaxID=3346101 RepID=UPI00363A259A
MARPRTFDEQQVLTAAMHAFRRQGFARTSVVDLEQATGLRTSSLYQAFGDKTGLFRRALEHYVEQVVGTRLAAHAGPDAGLDDLEQLFLTLFLPPLDDGHGCLLVNSAAEFGGDGTVPGHRVADGLALVRHAVAEVVRRELGDDRAGPAAARLDLLYHGLLVLSRAGQLTGGHEAAVRREFDALRAATRRPEEDA